MERTFVMLKPGILQRRIAGEILNRFERKGLKIIACKMMRIDEALAEAHYAEHKGKPFYKGLIRYTTAAPVIAMILEGKDAIALVRGLTGATSPAESKPGTIRGDFAASGKLSIVHASDKKESAQREIPLFFKPEEIFTWDDPNDPWFYDVYDS
jgi:nucleoside-diphosphate kinase